MCLSFRISSLVIFSIISFSFIFKLFQISEDLQYNFENPVSVLKLDKSLSEISGLGFHTQEDVLLAINDEKGIIYKLNKTDGKIRQKTIFAKYGDYEGIEQFENKTIVINSSGVLFFRDFETNKTKKISTKLSTKNNIEGLAFDKTNKQLLLACKENSINSTKENIKSIYALDINNLKLNDTAYLEIHLENLSEFVIQKNSNDGYLKRIKKFAPSGIAIQPENRDIYIISARGSSLLIFSKDEVLKNIVFLNEDQLPQPEGITFDNSQNLYISTEAKRGKIFVYEMESAD